ncbi:MAG: hypothetical protein FD138_3678 [Planctomycetota bacterium]|nr:MAG: hypothetical protein FD138_3678 [Planctomycetota bacterium]
MTEEIPRSSHQNSKELRRALGFGIGQMKFGGDFAALGS